METVYEGTCCTDCLMLMANGTLGGGDEKADREHDVRMVDHLNSKLTVRRWQAVPAGDENDEPHFSRRPCDACGSALGGDRERFVVLVEKP